MLLAEVQVQVPKHKHGGLLGSLWVRARRSRDGCLYLFLLQEVQGRWGRRVVEAEVGGMGTIMSSEYSLVRV